jgi:cystathionine beta-lyase
MEIINPKGTYLLWFKVINSEGVDLKKHFEDYGVGLSNGAEFGNAGWMRLNFGTNLDLLKKAASRIHKALDALVL